MTVFAVGSREMPSLDASDVLCQMPDSVIVFVGSSASLLLIVSVELRIKLPRPDWL